ncbi:hypothetical protein Tsubulata_016078 [Turnera subulata]|uniref:Uncharacterized protein n=1 Tax=Turnera subulata TaxID=218843 RepID=A0A9Q0F758_9ROSI|nr:hypothetical protein Tsubulata_016078 [Turnera subulata]
MVLPKYRFLSLSIFFLNLFFSLRVSTLLLRSRSATTTTINTHTPPSHTFFLSSSSPAISSTSNSAATAAPCPPSASPPWRILPSPPAAAGERPPHWRIQVQGEALHAPDYDHLGFFLHCRRLGSCCRHPPEKNEQMKIGVGVASSSLFSVVRDEIEHLLDDNEDLAELYLMRKWMQNQ